MDEVVYTKITNTAVPARSRWTNELYKKEYLRWWRHNVRGLKRRPTKNDDGTMYKDTHPECRYMDYYKQAKIWKCEVCEVEMTEGMKNRHLKSKRHMNNIAKKELLFEKEKKVKQLQDEIRALHNSTDERPELRQVYCDIIQRANQTV